MGYLKCSLTSITNKCQHQDISDSNVTIDGFRTAWNNDCSESFTIHLCLYNLVSSNTVQLPQQLISHWDKYSILIAWVIDELIHFYFIFPWLLNTCFFFFSCKNRVVSDCDSDQLTRARGWMNEIKMNIADSLHPLRSKVKGLTSKLCVGQQGLSLWFFMTNTVKSSSGNNNLPLLRAM